MLWVWVWVPTGVVLVMTNVDYRACPGLLSASHLSSILNSITVTNCVTSSTISIYTVYVGAGAGAF